MDGLVSLIWLAIGFAGVAGLIVAIGVRERGQNLKARLEALETQNRKLWTEVDRLGAANRSQGTAPAAKTTDVGMPSAEARPSQAAALEARAGVAGGPATPSSVSPAKLKLDLASATSTAGFEQRIGGSWTVWVGGLALALGALLLVRYTIEQGYFGPPMRIALGAILSASMVGLGDWLRRTQQTIKIDAFPDANIPAVLTAAGTVGAFGTVFAAHALYGFVGAPAAFVLLGAIALAALAAAAVHGPALAGLGLAGSFVTPVLVTSDNASPWPVVMFLAVVAAAAYRLAFRKQWNWLAAAAAGGGALWSLVFAFASASGEVHTSAAMAHTLLQLWLGIYMLAVLRDGTPADAARDEVAKVALAAFAVVAVLILMGTNGLSLAYVIFAALVIATLSCTMLWAAPLAPAALYAGFVALGALAVWPREGGRFTHSRVNEVLPDLSALEWLGQPVATWLFVLFAVLACAAVFIPAVMRLWRTKAMEPSAAAVVLIAACVTPLAALVIAGARVAHLQPSLMFGLAGLALAGLFAAVMRACEAEAKSDASPVLELATGAFSVAAIAAVSLALMFVLSRGPLTVALALTAYAAAVVSSQRHIALLRPAVAAIGFTVLARVVHDPRIMGADVGTMPVFNWLLLGYGVPALAFYGAARQLAPGGTGLSQRVCEALGIVFAALLAFFEIRHGLNHGDVLAARSDHVEQGLLALTGFLFSYALMRSGVSTANPVFRFASYCFGVVSAAVAMVSLGLVHNPAFVPEPVSGMVPLSSLVLGYLLPAAGAAAVTRAARTRWPIEAVWVAAACTLSLLFAYVTLEVRHAFQGPYLSVMRPSTGAEVWAYSAVWLLLGIALLAYGMLRGAADVRLASAIIVVAAVLKVFLFDLAGVEGFWRALSFIGLGVVLLGIGLVYQRVLAAPRQGDTPN